jgi:hypothetical protein
MAGFLVALIIACLLIWLLRSTPEQTFKRFVADPIPQSVKSIEEGHLFAMDSTFLALHFYMSSNDLTTLLRAKRFTQVQSQDMARWDDNGHEVQLEKGEYFDSWQKRIHSTTGMSVSFTTNWEAFSLKEDAGHKKYIFYEPTKSEVVFVAVAY